MKREILFRGKRIDNGNWEEGMLCQFHREVAAKISPNDFGAFVSSHAWVVDPSTVGQYTGLTDKNGVKIFEGDIVEFQIDNDDCPFPDKDTKKRIGRVYFAKFRASFAIAMGPKGSSGVNNDLFKYVQNGNRVSVIGNIHDNPELIKEAAPKLLRKLAEN